MIQSRFICAKENIQSVEKDALCRSLQGARDMKLPSAVWDQWGKFYDDPPNYREYKRLKEMIEEILDIKVRPCPSCGRDELLTISPSGIMCNNCNLYIQFPSENDFLTLITLWNRMTEDE